MHASATLAKDFASSAAPRHWRGKNSRSGKTADCYQRCNLPPGMKTASLLTAFLALAFALQGRADPLDERLEKLRLMLAEAAAKAEAATGDDSPRQRMVAETLRRGVEMLLPEVGEGLGNALRQISAAAPAEARAEADALLRDLPKLTEERDDRTIAAIEELVKKTGSACLAAKTEAELDPLLREVSRPQRGQFSRSEDPRPSRSYRKLQAAQHTVAQWQDYLAQRTAGNAKAAYNILQSIGNQGDYPIIPQEEITRRLSALAPTQGVAEAVRMLREIKTLDMIPAVIDELRARLNGQEGEYAAHLATLGQIANAYSAYRAGLIGAAFQTATAIQSPHERPVPGNLNGWTAETMRLQGLLLLAVLPRYLELAAAPAPAAGEDGATYLLRLADESAAAGHWLETARIVETYRLVAFRSQDQVPTWIAEDVTGLKAFAVAEQLAAAQAFAEAIKSFRQAAGTNGKYAPSARAAVRLGEITSAHPEEAKIAAASAQTDQLLQQIQRKFTDEAARAFESRLPPDIRNRLTPPRPNP